MKKLIAGLVVLLAVPCLGQRVIEKSFFGMHVKSSALVARMPIEFGTIGPMPGSAWKWLEPQNNHYNWGGYDAWVNAAHKQGYDIVYSFLRTPEWAGPSAVQPPKDLNSSEPCEAPAQGNGDCYFKSFVYTLVSRYKGKIKYYQMWNEPNSSGFWNGSIKDLVHMGQDAAAIIHQLDPDAQVLTPAISPTGYPNKHDKWLADYLREGGAQFSDIGTWHGYLQATTFTAPWPEHADSATPGCDTGTWRCPGSVLDTYHQMRSVLDANGMSGKPLWDTEGGWGVNDDKHSDLPDPNDQAAWVARWFIVQAGAGVPRAIWYMADAADGWGRLMDQTGQLNPAGVAYKQVYSWLLNASISPCQKKNKVWSCELTRTGGYTAELVWADGGSTNYSVPSQLTGMRDLTGGSNPVQGGQVSLTQAPILLESAAAAK